MSLQDLRGLGTPADTGVFEFPCEVLVFQHVFNGVTYVCAVRHGDRGWILVNHLSLTAVNNATVIQSALNALTAGRTWKETVYVRGDYTIGARVQEPSYTILGIHGRWTLANGVNGNMIENSDLVGGNVEIEINGGMLYGNFAGQTSGSIVYFRNCSSVDIEHVEFYQGWEYAIDWSAIHSFRIQNCYFNDGGGDDSVTILTSYDGVVSDCEFTNWDDRYAGRQHSCLEIESNSYDIFVVECVAHDPQAVAETSAAFTVDSGSRITFDACTVRNCGAYVNGFHIGKNNQDVSLLNCKVFTITDFAFWVEDSAGTVIDGCSVRTVTVRAMMRVGGASIDTIVSSNTFSDCNNSYPAIQLMGTSTYTTVIGCIFATCLGGGIIELNTTNYNLICENTFRDGGGTVLTLLNNTTRVFNNRGYNPKGVVANAYTVAAGNIQDNAGAQAFPTSNTNYTITHSPKFITIYGGTVTSISIDGTATGLTSGGFYLSPGQVLNVVWTGQPSSVVYAV